jgi:putative ABC transport system permease protein
MLKNYLRTALRNLMRNKTYGLLNILGLSVGVACAALIFLWVEDEVTYNHIHDNRDRLYKVMENQTYDGTTFTFGATPGPLAPSMVREIPGIKHTSRTNWGSRLLFSLGDKSIYEQGFYADSNFLTLFQFPLIKGNPSDLFTQLHSLVISEKMAKKFFGKEDPVGKTLRVNNDNEYVITGVFRDVPTNSTLQFDWLAPFDIYLNNNDWLQGWGSNGIQTWVELQPNADVKAINKTLYNYIFSKESEAIAKPFLFAMNDWRLYNRFDGGKQVGGRIEYVRLFTIIAWVILIIACINFMNLATARSEQRAREVGVRKVLGAGKRMLVTQFIGESILMSFIAVLIAVGLVIVFLPGFNTLVEKQLSINLGDPMHIAALVLIALVCGLVSGSYPSLYLSSFNPITVFKGLKIKGGSSAVFIRKGLVVVQFALSITLIIGTIIIYQQIQHIKKRQLGFDKDHVLFLELEGDMEERFAAIRNELVASGQIANAALSSSQVYVGGNNGDNFSWQGKDPNKSILITNTWASPEFINTLGIQLKYGRDFNPDGSTDSLNLIINESFAAVIGKENPVGDVVKFDTTSMTIVGVMKDFVYDDMYGKPGPLALFCYPQRTNYLFVRVRNDASITTALQKIESVVKTHAPGYPVEYNFLDQEFSNMFKSEMLIGQLSKLFAILAIFISCLGLFGLAAYTAERRTKEIGIRRVLGASVSGIAGLLSKDFMKLVGVAALIAFPIAWWAMQSWLEDFAYRINIQAWVFMAAGVIALVIALLTIVFQAIKAAIANPIKSLRTE